MFCVTALIRRCLAVCNTGASLHIRPYFPGRGNVARKRPAEQHKLVGGKLTRWQSFDILTRFEFIMRLLLHTMINKSINAFCQYIVSPDNWISHCNFDCIVQRYPIVNHLTCMTVIAGGTWSIKAKPEYDITSASQR